MRYCTCSLIIMLFCATKKYFLYRAVCAAVILIDVVKCYVRKQPKHVVNCESLMDKRKMKVCWSPMDNNKR